MSIKNNNMLQSWILDLIIRDGKIETNCPKLNSSMWFVVSADGITRPFSTNESKDANNPSWNFAARMILQFTDIQRSYIYFTLCTKDPQTQEIVCIGRSRLGLRAFPIGSPKTFVFPVMRTENASRSVLSLRVTATLSNLDYDLHNRNNY